MIPAAVGFQCPECVRQGRSSVGKPARSSAAESTANPHAATYALIGLNVLVFLFEISSTVVRRPFRADRRWRYSVSPNSAPHVVGIAHGEYYRLLTSMFLHEPPSYGGAFFLHILFNMWALFVVGPPLEALLGRVRFVAMYLLTGLAGSVFAYVLTPPNVPELGRVGCDLRPVRCAAGRRAAAATEYPAHRAHHRLEPGAELFAAEHQLAGPHRRSGRRRCAWGGLGLRAATQPDGDPDRQFGRAGGASSWSWSSCARTT